MTVHIQGVEMSIVPMHGLLDMSHNMKVFSAGAAAPTATPSITVVVATNMAESSVTIPGVHTVIDFGTKREVHTS